MLIGLSYSFQSVFITPGYKNKQHCIDWMLWWVFFVMSNANKRAEKRCCTSWQVLTERALKAISCSHVWLSWSWHLCFQHLVVEYTEKISFCFTLSIHEVSHSASAGVTTVFKHSMQKKKCSFAFFSQKSRSLCKVWDVEHDCSFIKSLTGICYACLWCFEAFSCCDHAAYSLIILKATCCFKPLENLRGIRQMLQCAWASLLCLKSAFWGQ